jgi:cytochrome oxidase Cu insertion factor (SCO1/SenC/PrrC family)
MASSMAQIPQPHAQAAMVSAFASFAAGHAFAVNLFVVVALGAFGIAFLTGRGLRAAVPAAVVFCAADWALVQDFGVPGGLGTDPNSMVPWMVLLAGGYLAMTQPASLPAAAGVSAGRLPALRQAVASATARSVTGLGAFAVVLVGAAPMAAATADRTADPIIARALAGPPVPLDRPAPRFRLLDVSGQPVTLMSLRGRVLLLTFLDPVCADCPVIAQEMKAAGARLGPAAGRVSLVAISADSTRSGPAFLRAFDRQQGLTSVPNWLFLTGSVAQLQPVWDAYEKIAPRLIIGMTARADLIFVIDRSGQIRLEIPDSPAPATASARSSFAGLLTDSARQALTGP